MSFSYIIVYHYCSAAASIDDIDTTSEGFKTYAAAQSAGERTLKEITDKHTKQNKDSYHTIQVFKQVDGHYEPAIRESEVKIM